MESKRKASKTALSTSQVEDALRRSFAPLARQPICWFLTGSNLMQCAGALRSSLWAGAKPSREPLLNLAYGPVCMMLAGFAIENMLKGLAIQADPALVSTTRLSKKLQTHELVNLWTLAGLTQLNSCRGILRALTAVTTSFGRYPVSFAKDGMAGKLNALIAPDFGAVTGVWTAVCGVARTRLPGWERL